MRAAGSPSRSRIFRRLRPVLVALPLAFAALPLAAQDAADLILRLDRLEADNRRLTGQVEELRFKLERVESEFRRFQTDTDSRFRDGGARAPAPGSAPVAPPAVAPPATGRRSDAVDPTASPGARGAPRPLTPGAAQPIDVTQAPRPVAPPPAAPTGTDAKAQYDFAKSLYDQGDLERSETAFRDFLSAHGRDRRAADALFFLGETYFRRTRYREAAEQFLAVTSRHSNAPRAPEAMLRLGVSLNALGAQPEACATLAQVPKKYPKASAAVKAGAERERIRAQC